MTEPIFKAIDCVMLRVAELEPAIGFYCDSLGHTLIWRTQAAVGLRLPGAAAELVLHTKQGPEVDLLVDDVEAAFDRFLSAGGESVVQPFDIPIGRCAVVRDPFGNTLVLLDQSKGAFATDADGRVIGVVQPY